MQNCIAQTNSVTNVANTDQSIIQNWTLDPDKTLAQNILDFSGYVHNQLPNDPVMQGQIVQGAVFKMNVEQSITDALKSKVNISNEVEDFLTVKSRRSIKTAALYRHLLTKFVDYLNDKKLDFLYLKVQDIDTWLNYQNSIHSPRTVRNNLATLSSFYQHLMIRHLDIFPVNIFYKRDLPRVHNRFKHDLITDRDFETIIQKFISINRKDMVAVLTLLNKYGWRSGVFEKMEIDTNKKTFHSVTKEHDIRGKLTQDEIDNIFKYKLLGSNQNKWAALMQRHCKSLYEKELLPNIPSLHDIRRRFIKQGVKKCKNAEELVIFSKTLHKNINTTLGYNYDLY